MITHLELNNFKSWPRVKLGLKPITGLFGANSSGKSALLQAILLLKQTAESPDRGLALHFGDEATPVNLGDFQSVAHYHDPEAKLLLALEWERDTALRVVDSAREDRTVAESQVLGFEATISRNGGTTSRQPRVTVEQMVYQVESARFGMKRTDRRRDYEVFSEAPDFEFVRPRGRPYRLPAPFKCYGFPDQVRAYFRNAEFLSDLELAFEDCLRGVYYLGPLRAYPRRQYPWTGAQPADMGEAGQQAIDAILGARERAEKISPGPRKHRVTLERYVADWLKKLGLIHDFRVEGIAEGSQLFQVKVRKDSRSPEVLITDIGFGVSQILPVLVLCFYVPEGSTVILEQPEIHLHPAVQAGLADVLIDAHQRRRIQILVESHSEHLLRRLQRRIAEQAINHEAVAMYFCENVEGTSRLQGLDIDLFGNIRNYPTDFFGDQMGEVAKITKAQIERRVASG